MRKFVVSLCIQVLTRNETTKHFKNIRILFYLFNLFLANCLFVLGAQHWSRGYKTFFILNSAEHEILNAHQYKISRNSGFFGLNKLRMHVSAHKC